jgi:phosphoenolpyruvate-protein kinase (PTS system EI component)
MIIVALAAVAAVAGIYSAVTNGQQAKEDIRSRNELRKANASAANVVREANNTKAAALGNLARWMQSVNNNRALDNAALSLEQVKTNYLRQVDSSRAGDFQRQLQMQEQSGAYVAARAYNGISGNVADMVGGSMALRQAMAEQTTAQYYQTAEYDQKRKVQALNQQLVGGLDQSLILDALDYNRNVTLEEAAPSSTAPVLAATFQGLSSLAGAAGSHTASPQTSPAPDYFAFDFSKKAGLLSPTGVDTSMGTGLSIPRDVSYTPSNIVQF